MDCCLCSFDFNNMKINYSNANNSFILLEMNELIISKSNKMPVGAGHSAISHFLSMKMKIKKDDLVITFTDGYADQFGGQKEKIQNYKQLEELLISNAHLPLSEIKIKLNHH